MLRANAASDDFGPEIVFAEDWGTREAAEHGDLADMIEGVGNRALENSFY